MKNLISGCRLWLVALMLFSSLAMSIMPMAQATPLSDGNVEIEPYYTGTISVSASLRILSSGDAECWGHVDCIPGYTADSVMRLQWLDGNVWRNYYSWYDEGDAADFYGVYPLIKGRTYRVRVIGDVFDSEGNWVEMVDAVSGSAKY